MVKPVVLKLFAKKLKRGRQEVSGQVHVCPVCKKSFKGPTSFGDIHLHMIKHHEKNIQLGDEHKTQDMDWTDFDEKVVQIKAEVVEKGKLTICQASTGSIIYNDGINTLILTCGHTTQVYFKFPDVKFMVIFSGEEVPATLLTGKDDGEKEVSILYCKCGKRRKFLEFSNSCEVGENVFMSSYAYGFSRILHTHGMVNSTELVGKRYRLPIDNIIECSMEGGKGSSGAAVVCKGKLVGIYFGATLIDCILKNDNQKKKRGGGVDTSEAEEALYQLTHGMRLVIPVKVVFGVIGKLHQSLGLVQFESVKASNVFSFLEEIVKDQYDGASTSQPLAQSPSSEEEEEEEEEEDYTT